MYRKIYGGSKASFSQQNYDFLLMRKRRLAKQAEEAEAREKREKERLEAEAAGRESGETTDAPTANVTDGEVSGERTEAEVGETSEVVVDSTGGAEGGRVEPCPRPWRLLVWRYGPGRLRPKPHEEDMTTVEDRLDEESRRELEAVRLAEKEKEEKARLEAEKLEELKKEIILVETIDEHIPENTQAHHTDLYDCTEEEEENPQLVLRRGQEFKMTLTFQRPYNKETDDLFLVFSIGESPNVHKKTCAKVKLCEDDDTKYMEGKRRKWGARISEQNENSMTINVYIPPDAVIGLWEYSVRTKDKGTEYEYQGAQDLVVLLNPWCPEDQVYMENTEDLNEYVLNEVGSVFRGSYKRYRSNPWNYGQFRKGILSISLRILRLANNLAVTPLMRDPVYIARALSRILNDCDDNGVLSGNWSGDYSGGARPLSWKGSPAILRQFAETNKPVKYGQCWVFSHLLTTVARCLGLPCRSVTNFASAHDTDLTMTIDKYVDDDGEPIDYLNSDSVWNFHVWNDVWMRRPDLDKAFGVEGKYDGWQAVDATPQELSESVYQCGPSPLAAIKLGEVNVGYDTKFIFGEVNAERCTWLNSEPPSLVKRSCNCVGKCMSTKYPDGGPYKKFSSSANQSNARLDVTSEYKAAEGSAAERAAVENAVGEGEHGDILFGDDGGVELSIKDEPSPTLGEDFELTFEVKNTSEEEKKVTLRANVRPANYWGSIIGTSKIESARYAEKTIAPGEAETFDMSIKANQYIAHCDDALTMRVLLLADVDGNSQPVVFDDDLVVEAPEIVVEGPTEGLSSSEVYDVTVTYENPTQMPMTECELRVDGSVFLENDEMELKHSIYHQNIGTLEPGQKETLTLKARPSKKPLKTKARELSITLASKEFPDFEGELNMMLA